VRSSTLKIRLVIEITEKQFEALQKLATNQRVKDFIKQVVVSKIK